MVPPLRARDLRQNVSVFRGGGYTLAPPTPPVVRVVLLHTEPAVQDLCPGTVAKTNKIKSITFFLTEEI